VAVQTLQIFLSHSTGDLPIAEALKNLLEDLFGKHRVRVEFSSDQEAGGGIPPGAEWLPWIIERITRADKTYVLLTPSSMKKPWVLWESGAAAGVALATKRSSPVVPITFGIDDADVPGPLRATQHVRGDTDGAGGIIRLLQDLNGALDQALTDTAFVSTTKHSLPDFFAKIKAALEQSSPVESLLVSVPNSFSANGLGGLWVTCYEFLSGGAQRYHADIVQITAESDRRVTAKNHPPEPRTDGHRTPFRNAVEAELANRHLIGHWKNISDTRYFGSIHLAVLTGETVMEGHYTSFSSDVLVGTGHWRWVRLDPATLAGVDLSQVTLREPGVIHARLEGYSMYAGPLALADVAEGI
jgi:TIR domain